MTGIYSQGGSAGHRYAGWLETVEAKNFQFGGKVFNGSPSAIYVGSNLVWGSDWLTVAAQKAIRGAFGQRDGWAVIKATNAYLNQLAASGQAGKDKATALAGFINEDPMMVCSLGLEVEGVTMPIRWLVGDGTAYAKTNLIPANGITFGVKFQINDMSGYGSSQPELFGSRYGTSSQGGYFLQTLHVNSSTSASIFTQTISGGTWTDYGTVNKNTTYEAEFNFRFIKLNGATIASGTYNPTGEQFRPIWFYGCNWAGSVISDPSRILKGRFAQLYRKDENGNITDMIYPIKRNGVCKWINVYTGDVCEQVGTFTESYTLPDGTHWTPSTP